MGLHSTQNKAISATLLGGKVEAMHRERVADGLAEESLGFVHEAFANGIDALVAKLAEFLELGPLSGVQPGGNFHHQPDMKVSASIPMHIPNALSLESKGGTTLSSCRNFDLRLT